MVLAYGVFLALVCLGVVLWPFLKASRRPARREFATPSGDAQGGGRQRVYQEMKTLLLEYQLGHVDEEEYQARTQEYRLEAARAIREQERLEQTLRGLDETLEQQVQALRSVQRGAAPLSETTAPPQRGETA